MKNTVTDELIERKSQRKKRKQKREDDIFTKVEDILEKQEHALNGEDVSNIDKAKERVRITLSTGYLIVPKSLAIILLWPSIWIPTYVLLKVLSAYFTFAPENSETDNHIIKKINSTTWINHLLKQRPIYLKEMRELGQKHFFEWMVDLKEASRDKIKKVIRV